MTACIYKHLNSAGLVIYVGVTANLKKRTAQHKCASHWFHMVKEIEHIDFDNWREACNAEKSLIISLAPLYNQVHHPDLPSRIVRTGPYKPRKNKDDGRRKTPICDWLAKTGRKQSWLAAQIGRTESHLSRIIKLVEPASLVDRMAIQAATSGDVKADQWPDVAP